MSVFGGIAAYKWRMKPKLFTISPISVTTDFLGMPAL